MYTVGDIINDLQSYGSHVAISELLQNKAFTARLTGVIKSLPDKSKKTVRGIILRDPKKARAFSACSRPSEEALRAIYKVKKIALPASVNVAYQNWKDQPETFWNSQGFCIGDGTILQIYEGMKQLETQRQSGTIVWRYFTLFFYDLMHLIGEGK
ncbi:hypothetical protein V501_01619, partial [Pseudogymnoascus sp. VKM F-4519 (FW-2642)]